MEVRVTMKVKPWISPNYVFCEIGDKENSIPLSSAPHDAVQQLVVTWMKDVYGKAGMTPNWRFE
jgi:hypothetical protein